ncbi:MAG: hypothetical protein LBC02_00965 [Planctomycetaceae bacterium]|jgi:hypothetical protein|nr:hypothetical protein [Planctomycetaceae bacterium]
MTIEFDYESESDKRHEPEAVSSVSENTLKRFQFQTNRKQKCCKKPAQKKQLKPIEKGAK